MPGTLGNPFYKQAQLRAANETVEAKYNPTKNKRRLRLAYDITMASLLKYIICLLETIQAFKFLFDILVIMIHRFINRC